MHPTLIRISRPYLTTEQIELLQQQSGMAGKAGSTRLVQAYQLAWNLCRSLRLPMRTLNTAALLLQRTLIYNINKESPLTLVCACVLVATKIEDTPKKAQDVALAALRLRNTAAATKEAKAFSSRVLQQEQHILESDCFDFRIRHPHAYVVKIAHTLGIQKEVAATAWTIASDMFSTVGPLKQPAHTLALAAIVLSTKLHKASISLIDSASLGSHRHDVNDALADILDFYLTYPQESLLGRGPAPNGDLTVFSSLMAAINRELDKAPKLRPTESSFDGLVTRNGNTIENGTTRYVLEWQREHLGDELTA